MRRPQGYATTHVDGVLVEEQDTFTCGHCNAIVPVLPGQVDTFSCKKCDSHICNGCAAVLAATLKCVPFEKKLDRVERAARNLIIS